MSLWRGVALWVAVVLLLGCERAAPATDKAPESVPASSRAASDMCERHGVLQAVCTRCNPGLAAVFRSRGDWCAAHDWPESFCPVCHPEQGGRPAAAVDGSSEEPAEGTLVRLRSADVARMAGLETVRAQERMVRPEVTALARVLPEASRRAQVHAPVAGTVRAVKVDVGTPVRPGSPLCVLESAEIGEGQARLKAALARESEARGRVERVESLLSQGLVPQKEAASAAREHQEARSELDAARAAAAVTGAPQGAARYTLTSPIAGVVTRREVTLGQYLGAEYAAFEVVDASHMSVQLAIAEAQASGVMPQAAVQVQFDGFEGRLWEGRLTYVAPEVDPHTRTVLARLTVANADGALRANALGRARIALGEEHKAVVVPRDAVQRVREVAMVFVRVEPEVYEVRRVQTGAERNGGIEVRGRVVAGDEVVTTGSFLLKTETLKESIGAGCCEVP